MAQSAPGPMDATTPALSHTSSFRSALPDPYSPLARSQSKTQTQVQPQPHPVRRTSSIQDILSTGRRRSEILSASSSQTHLPNQSQPLRKSSSIRITPEQAEHLREHEEFLEWKRQKSQRERERIQMQDEDVNERSAIVGRERTAENNGAGHSDYGTNRPPAPAEGGDLRSRPSTKSQKSAQSATQARDGQPSTNSGQQNSETQQGWWKKLVDQFGSLELENKGSVARDHLALERTFLAWLRTSLAFASIGIAVTQLFRLNTSLATSDPANEDSNPSTGTHLHLRALGKPIGATFIAISIVVLFTGYHRYFESQHWIIRGKFPASRGSVALISVIALLLMVASFVLILVVEPRTFEK